MIEYNDSSSFVEEWLDLCMWLRPDYEIVRVV